MTTITATPDVALGAVNITITKTEAINSLVRADVNGTKPVRATAGFFPSAGTSGTLELTDHEAALTGPILYRAGASATAWTAFPKGMEPRLTLPLHPSADVLAKEVTDYSYSRETAGTIHEIIGREEDPVIIRGGMKARRGSLEIIVDNFEQVTALENLLSLRHTVQYRQGDVEGMDFYFSPLSLAPRPEADGAWSLTVSYIKTAFPVGDRIASWAWTFSDLAAAPGATFGTVAQDYKSFTALAMNEKS
jgi:hypothetical protein